jgi:tetratricopeptide (TPR) repeat protein
LYFHRFFLRFNSTIMMSNAGSGFIRTGCLALVVIAALLRPVLAVDTNDVPGPDGQAAEAAANTSSQDSLRSYLQIQDQLRTTLSALEKNRQEAEAKTATNAQALEERLRLMEKTFSDGRLEQMQGMERSDRMILMAAGIFAAIGFLVLLLAAFLQWTAVNRLSAAAVSLAAVYPRQLSDMGSAELPPTRALEPSTHFLALMERLEQRIHQLEASIKPAYSLPESNSSNGNVNGPIAEVTSTEISRPAAPGQASAVNLLLHKSQTLLKLDKPEAALDCLEEVLALDSSNTDALVKKGAALERLQRFDEAIQCYDRAIAQDNSMTMAYLYKGGVFNRTERYSEALACYEQALKRIGKPARPQV